MTYKRILVPVDGSPTSAKGLKEAIRLARERRGKLRLLHVVEELGAFIAPERGARAAGARPEAALAEDFGGRVADAIVRDAQRWRADLIVMGTHGRRGMKHALLGSDAERVIHASRIPVLLVPARE